jgi:hypothetical protein
MTATGSIASCTQCGSQTYVEPLHGERGGPPYCPICAGAWHAEHGQRRRAGRVVIRAIKAFFDAGGKSGDVDKLKNSAALDSLPFAVDALDERTTDPLGYMDGIARLDAADIDLTLELLAATLALTHPDKHPPEFKAEANRVTQLLLALKPFVFPAPKPKPVIPAGGDYGETTTRPARDKPSPAYPCADCADAVPADYCNACKAEWEKRQQQESEARTKKQRRAYKRRRERALVKRLQRQCPTCGMQFRIARTDARYCSDTCRKRAHRKTRALVTDKQSPTSASSSSRDMSLENRILKLLKRYPAVFLNDILPMERTRAEYQALCLAAVKLERENKIESFSYPFRWDSPGHKVLRRPGYSVERPSKIPRLIKRPKPRPPKISARFSIFVRR